MTRSRASKRILDAATLIAAATTLPAAASFVWLASHSGSRELGGWNLVAFVVFGASCMVLFFCFSALNEDMKRIGLSNGERRRWTWGTRLIGPLALFLYWNRYVRNAELRPDPTPAPLDDDP